MKIMLIGWVDDSGVELTGRHVWRDGVLIPEFITAKAAKACVWSSDPNDFAAGQAFAEREGKQWTIMDDSEDVLNRYRQQLLENANEI
jgi:hypothetical protein